MPDDFKVVIAGLFELARDNNTSSTPSAAAAAIESSSDEAVALGEGGRRPTGDKIEGAPDSGGEKKEKEAADQGVPTEGTTDEATVGEDDGGQGNDSAVLEKEEGPSSNIVKEKVRERLTDSKTFAARFLQWAEEAGRATKPSKIVRAKPPTRVFPL